MNPKAETTQTARAVVRIGGRQMRLSWRPRKRLSDLLTCLLLRAWKSIGFWIGSLTVGASSLTLAAPPLPTIASNALPSGAQLVAGQASISQSGNTLNIVQGSNQAILNWNSFNIGSQASVNFQQPNSTASILNRVTAADPSVLLGQMTANGRVWLINPAGILVGQGARIDVGGFVASTLNVRNEDFLAGRLLFQATPGAGGVVNQGAISTSSGGSVYLIAPAVSNEGLIQAPNGEVILAAGQTVELIDTGTPGVKVEISGDGSSTNLSQIISEAGRIGMAAAFVRNSGTLNASSLVQEGGRIFLRASQSSTVDQEARLQASGRQGGTIEVLGRQVAVLDQARLDASGTEGGGTILIGGDYQGKNLAILNAQATEAGPNVILQADALQTGNGGQVILWADDSTRAHASISARGGARGGDGGLVETSGKHLLDVTGTRVDTRAANGRMGTWLLDPGDITIAHSTTPTGNTNFAPTDASSTIADIDISTALATTDVTLSTSMGTGDTGNITVNGSADTGGAALIQPTGAGSLTLMADKHLTLHSGARISTASSGHISLSSTNGNLSIEGATIRAAGWATLSAPNGWIQTTGDTAEIAADTLLVSARDGINLKTAVAKLTAYNSSSGDISISNSGNLTLDDYAMLGGSIRNNGTGHLILNTTAASSSPGDIALNANVSANGRIEIHAAGDLTQNGGSISNYLGNATTAGNNDVILSGNNLTLRSVGSQRDVSMLARESITIATPNLVSNAVQITGAQNFLDIDDSYFDYNLPFTFQFYGTSYNKVYVGSNGYLTFGSGWSEYVDGASYLQSQKIIAPAWNDWVTSSTPRKDIYVYAPSSNSLAFRWDVAAYANSNNTAQFETVLYNNGNIKFNYGPANHSFFDSYYSIPDVTIGLSNQSSSSTLVSQLMNQSPFSLNNLKSTNFIYNAGTGNYTEVVRPSSDWISGNFTGSTGGFSAGAGINAIRNASLTASTGSILNTSTATDNKSLTAANATLVAGGSIGSATAPLTTAVNRLSFSSTAGTFISNRAPSIEGLGTLSVSGSNTNASGSNASIVINETTGHLATDTSGGVSNSGGGITLAAAGDVVLNSAVSSDATGDAVVLSGANFINNAGSSAISTPTTGARWLIYSTNPDSNTYGDSTNGYLNSSNHALWSRTYASGNTVSESGNRYLFSYQPTLTFTSTDVSKTYGDDATEQLASAYSVGGLHGGVTGAFLADTATNAFRGTPALSSDGALVTANVSASPNVISIDTIDVEPLNGYAIASSISSGQLTVTARTLTLTGSKVYDGSTSFSGSQLSLGNIIDRDDVSLYGEETADTADKHVGSNKPFTSLSGFSLTGSAAGNYAVPLGGTASITARPLNVSYTGIDKIYDRSTSANVNTSDDRVTNDVLTINRSAAFEDRHVGNGKTVTITNVSLGGADAGNYSLTDSAGMTTADITPATLTISGLSAADKVYNGTRNATVRGGLTGVINGDTVTLTSSGSFDSKNVGAAKPVTASLSLGDTNDARNYVLSNATASLSATITPAILTVGSLQANDKTYDGTRSATVSGQLSDRFGNDQVNLDISGRFNDKNVGTNKPVTLSLGLAGADAANYQLANTNASASAKIEVRPLSTWTGSAGGAWSDAANWDAIPDGANVQAVSIPSGSGSVTFDASVSGTRLQTLTSSRSLAMTGGTLTIDNQLTTSGFAQSGGTLTGAGNVLISNSFSQTGGAIALTGEALASIRQLQGNLSIANLSAPSVILAAEDGAITQTGPIIANGLLALSTLGINLDNANNQVGLFAASNEAGTIRFVNNHVLLVDSITNLDGDIVVDNTGAFSTDKQIQAQHGSVTLAAHSPLTIGDGRIRATGNISLSAGSTSSPTSSDVLTIKGQVQSTAGTVSLVAGNSIVLDSPELVTAALGVTKTSPQTIATSDDASSKTIVAVINSAQKNDDDSSSKSRNSTTAPPGTPTQATSKLSSSFDDDLTIGGTTGNFGGSTGTSSSSSTSARSSDEKTEDKQENPSKTTTAKNSDKTADKKANVCR